MLIRFLMVMTPLVFFINGIDKGDWLQSLLFAVSYGQKRTLSATHDIAGNQRQADDDDREPYDDKKNQGPEPVGILKPLPRC